MTITVPFTHDQGSVYVPFMDIHAQLDMTQQGRFEIVTPIASSPTSLLNAVSKAADQISLFKPALIVNNEFGRTVQVTSVGAGTITIHGTDYLGQGISQTMTLVAATAQSTLKAFKTITRVVNGTAAGNLSLGHGVGFGMPFVLQNVLEYYVAGAIQSAGTTVAAVLTNPQTAATGDPRGTWAPAAGAAPNGVRTLEIIAKFNATDAVGGLLGYAGR